MATKKNNIDMVAIVPKKANAQNLTCFVTFIVTACLAVILMIMAWALPALVITTQVICWVCMALEASAAGLAWIAYWIKCNAL